MVNIQTVKVSKYSNKKAFGSKMLFVLAFTYISEQTFSLNRN
jgi:hypothetical protein